MILINCPWCGPRDDGEFSYGGQAHIARPNPSESVSDAQWGEYLFMRINPRGWHREQWFHAAGCRQWFNVERHTESNRIRRVYRLDEPILKKTDKP
jgi:sarcosine oxidase, subunit delta